MFEYLKSQLTKISIFSIVTHNLIVCFLSNFTNKQNFNKCEHQYSIKSPVHCGLVQFHSPCVAFNTTHGVAMCVKFHTVPSLWPENPSLQVN